MKNRVILLIIFIILLICILLSFTLGRYNVDFTTLIDVLLGNASDTPEATAILNIRLPRIIAAVLVGMCLSAAGASYQGVFQNPMAAPDILGASAGAGFGAALAIHLGFTSYGITAMAFLMSLITVFLVMFVAKYTRGSHTLGLVLSGIIISSLFQSATSFIKLVADPNNELPSITYWLMGSLVGITKKEVLFISIPMIIGIIPLILLRWRINIITLGDDEARSLGVNPYRVRTSVIICATLLTASSVAVSGMIGWIGLVIPHMMRRIIGSDYRYLLPASIFGGGLFLLLVDDLSRNMANVEIPIGILTAFIGAPFFLILITRRPEYK